MTVYDPPIPQSPYPCRVAGMPMKAEKHPGLMGRPSQGKHTETSKSHLQIIQCPIHLSFMSLDCGVTEALRENMQTPHQKAFWLPTEPPCHPQES